MTATYIGLRKSNKLCCKKFLPKRFSSEASPKYGTDQVLKTASYAQLVSPTHPKENGVRTGMGWKKKASGISRFGLKVTFQLTLTSWKAGSSPIAMRFLAVADRNYWKISFAFKKYLQDMILKMILKHHNITTYIWTLCVTKLPCLKLRRAERLFRRCGTPSCMDLWQLRGKYQRNPHYPTIKGILATPPKATPPVIRG